MDIWQYIFLFLSVVAAGGVGFYVRKNNQTLLQMALSFSGAFILGITFLHLIPETIQAGEHNIGLYILVGFFVQLFLEQFSGGVEHGHIHPAHHKTSMFAFSVMFGLSVHAFMEGMPLSGYIDLDHNHGHNHLLFGIIIHKLPAAFALVLLLLASHFSRMTTAICLIIFASMSPLGAGFAALLKSNELLNAQSMAMIMAVVIGSFLHISTTILFETDTTKEHRIPVRKLIAIAVGLGFAIATMH